MISFTGHKREKKVFYYPIPLVFSSKSSTLFFLLFLQQTILEHNHQKHIQIKMKTRQIYLIPVLVTFVALFAGCRNGDGQKNDTPSLPDTNMMKEDARVLAEKTAQCINLVNFDTIENNTSPTIDSNLVNCTAQLEKLTKQYEEKYKDSLAAVTFGHYFLEALQQTDISSEMKELYKELGR